MQPKISERDNIEFFENDMTSQKNSRYISRVLFAMQTRIFIKNFKAATFLAFIFGMGFYFFFFTISSISESVSNSERIEQAQFVEIKKTLESIGLEEFHNILQKPFQAHEKTIAEHYALYKKISEENKNQYSHKILYGPESLATDLKNTQQNILEIKNRLIPLFNNKNSETIPNYNHDGVLRDMNKFMDIKSGNVEHNEVIDNDYFSLVKINQMIKNILANQP